jgi:hypothetical protein
LITPNKALSLKESALGRLSALLRDRSGDVDLVTLYHQVADQFESIDQFLLALDILFLLGSVDVNLITRVVTYAG